MIKLQVPPAVRWIARTLEDAGFETWTVGGAVRDALFGTPSGDWDLTTRATPSEVQLLFKRTIPIGVDHGTVGVLSREGVMFEVTTFRRDVETTGRHAVVEFSQTLDEDLSRRDFTINAVAWHPLKERLHDPYDGQADLERRILRTVGDPEARFREDYLRVLRGLRFAGTFELTVEPHTWRGLVAAVEHTDILSPERLREELDRILRSDSPPSRPLALYAAAGVLRFLYPELDDLIGHSRDSGGDWFAHALRTVDLLAPHHSRLRWAALFQGVAAREGVVGAQRVNASAARERVVLCAAALLERLRSSNAAVREVAGLAPWTLGPPAPEASDAELRLWLSEAGRETLRSAMRVWIANLRADEARGAAPSRDALVETCARLRGLARSGVPLTVGELAISGRDLIGMGYKPGPRFGDVLQHLLELVLEDPSINRPEPLREKVVEWMERHESDEEDRGQANAAEADSPSESDRVP